LGWVADRQRRLKRRIFRQWLNSNSLKSFTLPHQRPKPKSVSLLGVWACVSSEEMHFAITVVLWSNNVDVGSPNKPA